MKQFQTPVLFTFPYILKIQRMTKEECCLMFLLPFQIDILILIDLIFPATINFLEISWRFHLIYNTTHVNKRRCVYYVVCAKDDACPFLRNSRTFCQMVLCETPINKKKNFDYNCLNSRPFDPLTSLTTRF